MKVSLVSRWSASVVSSAMTTVACQPDKCTPVKVSTVSGDPCAGDIAVTVVGETVRAPRERRFGAPAWAAVAARPGAGQVGRWRSDRAPRAGTAYRTWSRFGSVPRDQVCAWRSAGARGPRQAGVEMSGGNHGIFVEHPHRLTEDLVCRRVAVAFVVRGVRCQQIEQVQRQWRRHKPIRVCRRYREVLVLQVRVLGDPVQEQIDAPPTGGLVRGEDGDVHRRLELHLGHQQVSQGRAGHADGGGRAHRRGRNRSQWMCLRSQKAGARPRSAFGAAMMTVRC